MRPGRDRRRISPGTYPGRIPMPVSRDRPLPAYPAGPAQFLRRILGQGWIDDIASPGLETGQVFQLVRGAHGRRELDVEMPRSRIEARLARRVVEKGDVGNAAPEQVIITRQHFPV